MDDDAQIPNAPHADARPRWIAGAITSGLLLVASAAATIYHWPANSQERVVSQPANRTATADPVTPSPASTPVNPEVLRRQAWDKVARLLAPADAASLAAIERSLQPIDEFFVEHREGARPFAESVLSLRGKWKYVKTRGIFGGDSDDHLAFLDEKFRENVFDPAELQHVVQQSIADYVRAVQAIENKLLVNIRGELSDLDPHMGAAIESLGSDEGFAASYQSMLAQLVRDVSRGANADLGLFVGSFVAAEVTQQLMIRLGRTVATRLGVSAGVLGAGASGGAASAGVTIGLAIVIDMGIEWLLSLGGADAVSQVTVRVDRSLDRLHDLLLDGDATAIAAYHKIRSRRETFPTEEGRAKIQEALNAIESKGDLGLRRMLLKLHHERAKLREQALRDLVLEGKTT